MKRTNGKRSDPWPVTSLNQIKTPFTILLILFSIHIPMVKIENHKVSKTDGEQGHFMNLTLKTTSTKTSNLFLLPPHLTNSLHKYFVGALLATIFSTMIQGVLSLMYL